MVQARGEGSIKNDPNRPSVLVRTELNPQGVHRHTSIGSTNTEADLTLDAQSAGAAAAPERPLSKRETIVAGAETKAGSLIEKNPEAALALFMALGRSLGEAQYKPLKLVTVRDDGETFRGVRCPHCKTLLDAEDLTAVDWSTHMTVPDDMDADDGSITIRRYVDVDDEAEHTPLSFTAGCCDRPVSLGDLRVYR